jgi:hypothetical protein
MASTLNSRVLSNTYKDDFVDSDGYYRILFNSGRPLQARELTQMQTILQNQIRHVGTNLFKEGGVVKPGESILNNSYEFAKLDISSFAPPADPTTIVGTIFTGNTSGVTARIIEVAAADGAANPTTIYVAYTNAPAAIAGASTVRFTPSETITNGAVTLKVQTTNTTANPAVGRGTRFSISQGVYFAKGFFVFTESQSTIVSRYSDTANDIVGYKIVEQIITTDDDTGLYDNQGAVPNISSPGADRLRIRLELTIQSKITSTDNFIPIVTIKDGLVARVVDADNSFNIINDVIATRIKENSGDYLVKPFKLIFEEDSDVDNLIMKLSDGIAVVDGYRSVIHAPIKQRIVKPATTSTINNEVVAADYGNYVLVDAGGSNNTAGLPNINTFEQLNIRTAVAHGGSTIGTCRVRAVTEDTGNYFRYYLFDIQMNAGQNFRSAVSIGTSSSSYFNLYRPLSKAELKDVNKNRGLFALPRIRPQALDDISLTVQRRFQVTTNGSGAASISLTATGETFANVNDWIYAETNDDIILTSVGNSGAGSTAANLTGLPISATVEILAYVNKSVGVIRNKTLNEITITKAVDGNGNFQFEKPDIFEVIRVTTVDSDGVDVSNRFNLDNGQRDNYYAKGQLLLKPGYSAPSGDIFVRFKYFTHGVNGDFFAINSYTGQVDYSDIPAHRLNTGQTISLRNVLDFRSVVDSAGDFASTALGARINELPQVNDTVSADINYYMPQAAILTIDTEGNISLRRGAPSLNPQKPVVPPKNLPLFNVVFNANTLNDSDLTVEQIEHRRYTMRDISDLERRVDNLEEVTALSLLEMDTKNLQVFDSAGNDRTKSGFFVDNFSTQILSAIGEVDYRASIDPKLNFLAPTFNEDNIRLIYDSASSTNVIKRGDNIYLSYTEVPFITQSQASRSTVINPFEATIYHGDIDLSPSSDEWREINVRAKKMVSGGTKLDTTQAYLWNNWQWNWGGISTNDLKVGSTTNTKTDTTSTRIINNVNKVVSEETLLEVIDQRVLNITLIPFMRSKKVYFKAQGLRPSSKVWAYFDGVRVDSWVREETFTRISNDPTDYGNTQNNATQHPSGSSALTTDINGAVEGSFFIPNTNAIRFRTGVTEFKILDISSNREQASSSIARGLYAATGYLDTVDQTIKSTRVLNVEHIQTTENRRSGGGGGGGGGDDLSGGGNYQIGNSGSFAPYGQATISHHDTGIFDGGGTDPGGKVVCTAMNDDYGFGSFRNAIWLKYSQQKYSNTPEYEKGYHTIFIPLLQMRNKHWAGKQVYKVLKHIARHRTADLRAEMYGTKRDRIGQVERAVLEPLCYIVGKIKLMTEKGKK